MKNIKIKASAKRILTGTIVLTTISTNVLAFQYTIKKGDTLGKISQEMYGKPSYSTEIANYNNISNPNYIKEGEIIEIPDVNTLESQKYFVFVDREIPDIEIYTVKKGDTLGKICKNKYGSYEYLDRLAAYNEIINKDLINIGQTIKLPSSYELDKVIGFSYTIKKDDSFEKIALSFYGNAELGALLEEFNSLNSNNQVIFIPTLDKITEFYNAKHKISEGKINANTRNI